MKKDLQFTSRCDNRILTRNDNQISFVNVCQHYLIISPIWIGWVKKWKTRKRQRRGKVVGGDRQRGEEKEMKT